MLSTIFLVIFLGISSLLTAMEEEEHVSKKTYALEITNHFNVPKLTEIAAKKIYGYQQGNRNVKKTLRVLQSLPTAAAVHIAQQKNHNGDTLLHTAAYLGNENIVAYLLELGVHRRPRNKWNETPILVAAKQGHLDCYELLYVPEDRMEQDDHDQLLKFILAIPGERALKYAEVIESAFDSTMIPSLCAGGDINYLKSIIDRKDISFHDLEQGFVNAIRAGALEHIKILLKHDEDHSWLGELGEFEALYEATLCGQVAIARLLLDRGMTCYEALHCAVRTQNKKLVKIYYKKFPEQLNGLDESDKTPLCYAASYGFVSLVNWLLEKGASTNVEGEMDSALYRALMDSRNCIIVKSLLDRGARILENIAECDVLGELIEENDVSLVALLLPYCKQAGIPILFF